MTGPPSMRISACPIKPSDSASSPLRTCIDRLRHPKAAAKGLSTHLWRYRTSGFRSHPNLNHSRIFGGALACRSSFLLSL
jgi:hypothetical protein